MTVDTMRAIDKWLGIPLTFLLTLLVKAIEINKKPSTTAPKRILFIELSEMGSTILVNPALEKARDHLQAKLFFVIFRKNKASLDLLRTIEQKNIFTIREDSLFNLLLDTIKFLLWTRKNKIDTVVDLELFSRFTALLSGASGAVNRVGFHSFCNEGLYRGDLFTHNVAYNPHMHIAKNFIALVNSLITPESDLPYSKTVISDDEIQLPTLLSSPKEQKAIHQLIRGRFPEFDSESHRLVLINPNASELLPLRRWMPERYVELVSRTLRISDDIVVLITGAAGESGEAEQMCKEVASDRCINFAGATKLEELPALYNCASLMVTNDSGPGHFSSITPLPTIVLFGPETPALYGSLGNSTPVFAGLACSPCVSAANHRKTPCKDNRCLRAISVDQVFTLVKSRLSD